MANKRFNELPDASTPILGTDKILVSRDGINVTKTTVGTLPLPLTTAQTTRGDIDGVVGSTPGNKIAFSDGSSLSVKDKFNYSPVGFNYYSLAYEKIIGYSNADTARSELLQYIKDCGANLVRVALPVFQQSEFLAYMHNTGTIPSTVTDANLKPAFISAIDTIMADLATYKLKGMFCLNWGQSLMPTIFGETVQDAYTNTNSATAVYTKSFVQWFVNRYKNHAAMGVISFGNEYVWSATGTTYPTPTSLANYFSSCASIVRSIRDGILCTADVMLPGYDNTSSRKTMDTYIDELNIIFKDLDIINVHSYGPTYNYTGHLTSETSTFPNDSTSWYGFEGIPSLLSSMRNFADAVGKPLVIGEFSVQTTVENDSDVAKKSRFTEYCAAYADCSLLWNVQDTAIASASGQSTSFIDTGTTRATVYQEIVSRINKNKPTMHVVGAGTKAQRYAIKPKYAIKSDRVGSGTHIVTLQSSAGHASTTGYGYMAWMNFQNTLTDFENVSIFRTAATNGMIMQACNRTTNTALASVAYNSGGSVGDTNVWMPNIGLNEWVHVAFLHTTINKLPATQVWINGMYWRTLNRTANPDSIPAGTTMYAIGNASSSGSGVPMLLQDITLVPYASNDDIWRHMRGEVLPQSLIHVRGMPNGNVYDISKNSAALTVGSSIVVQAT